MENRQCIKCGEVKDICMFGKKTPTRISTICKKCENIRIRDVRKKRAKENEEYRKLKNKKRYAQRKKRMLADEEFRKHINKKITKRRSIRYKTDPLYNFKKKLRNNIRNSFKRGGFTKETKTKEILGAEWEVIKEYFEKRFQEGMTWDNQGEWHIDHILPISTATSHEDVIRLNHYTNLQPLWAEDNIKKSDELTPLGILKEHLPYSEVLEIKK
jgi:transcription-repair coupling factor (superfamily II helicase)